MTKLQALSSTTFVGVFAAGFVWAAISPMEETVSAPGHVSPYSIGRSLGVDEPGIVTSIQTRVGQEVSMGDVLLSLDATAPHSDLRQLDDDIEATKSDLVRLQAESAGRRPQFSGVPDNLRMMAQRRFDERAKRYLSQKRGYQEMVASLSDQLEIAQHRLNGTRELVAAGLRSPNDRTLLADQIDVDDLRGRLQDTRSKFEQAQATWHDDVEKDLADNLRKLRELQDQRQKVESRSDHRILRAPVDGTIKSVAVLGPGSAVQAGENLIEIVPKRDRPIIVVYLPPQYGNFVVSGQRVKIYASPFDSRLKAIVGVVTNVAPDTERPKDMPLQTPPSYRMDIECQIANWTDFTGKTLPLLAGTTVVAVIDIGERPILQHMLGGFGNTFEAIISHK